MRSPAPDSAVGAARNQVRLSGTLSAHEGLRFTPAGVPVFAFRLSHRSQQMEAHHPRQVELDAQAVAIGELAQKLAALPIGQTLMLSGFLANRNRRSTQLVLHVNEFEIE